MSIFEWPLKTGFTVVERKNIPVPRPAEPRFGYFENTVTVDPDQLALTKPSD